MKSERPWKVSITSLAFDPYFMLLPDFLIGKGDKLNSFHFHQIIVSFCLVDQRFLPSDWMCFSDLKMLMWFIVGPLGTVDCANCKHTPLWWIAALLNIAALLVSLACSVVQEVGSERQFCEKFSIASHRLVAADTNFCLRPSFSPADSRPLAAPVQQLQDGGGDGQVQG